MHGQPLFFVLINSFSLYLISTNTSCMKTRSTLYLIAIVVACTQLLSSCGTTKEQAFHKKRYSNWNWVKADGKVEHKAVKAERPVQKQKTHIAQNRLEEQPEVIVQELETITEEGTAPVVAVAPEKVERKKGHTPNHKPILSNIIARMERNTASMETQNLAEPVASKKENRNNSNGKSDADVDLIILVILAIIIPPLAVYLVDGTSTRFIINLILTLLGWGLFAAITPFLGLILLIAVIHALLIVLE
jgi:uncharacterized membrane protein YqaE (UPF0057 family)